MSLSRCANTSASNRPWVVSLWISDMAAPGSHPSLWGLRDVNVIYMSARAIILEPTMVILDEPISALDVSVRAQILNLLADIQEEHNLTYLIIAHDLAVLEHITDQIAIMYLGKIVETGDTQKIFSNPMHPYTKALLAAMPNPDPRNIKKTPALTGEIGNPINPPAGCRFNPRCPHVKGECLKNLPPFCKVSPGHEVACNMTKTGVVVADIHM